MVEECAGLCQIAWVMQCSGAMVKKALADLCGEPSQVSWSSSSGQQRAAGIRIPMVNDFRRDI